MRYALHHGDVSVPRTLARAIDTKVEKVKKRLKRYHPDVAEMEIRLSHQAKVNEYECKIVLRAFKDTLHCSKVSPELRVAVDKSFDALLREMETYRVRLNKSLQDHSA